MTRRKTKRVLIVDDHPLVRQGLSAQIVLEPDLEVCGEAEDVHTALQHFDEMRPDIAIVDIALKTGSGLDLIERLKRRDPSLRILVLSMYADSLYAERSLRAGAQGYINKQAAQEKVIEAVRQILEGRYYLNPEMHDRLLHFLLDGRGQSGQAPVETLSNRELEVFRLIGEGLKNAAIAGRLHVSVKTVEAHRQRIKTKLRLDSATELTRTATQWMLENG